jgi:hypothetical protein
VHEDCADLTDSWFSWLKNKLSVGEDRDEARPSGYSSPDTKFFELLLSHTERLCEESLCDWIGSLLEVLDRSFCRFRQLSPDLTLASLKRRAHTKELLLHPKPINRQHQAPPVIEKVPTKTS